jgi:hypothetical protein
MAKSKDRSDAPYGFEALRERVFELGGPFAPEAIADADNGLLGYVVLSVTALKSASERFEGRLGADGVRPEYVAPSDKTIQLSVAEQCRGFAGQLANAVWSEAERQRRLKEAGTDPPTPVCERVSEALVSRDVRNRTFLGLALLRLLVTFDRPSSICIPRSELPDWARHDNWEPTVGEVFAGALHFGDVGLLKRLLSTIKGESKTARKERDWSTISALIYATRDELRAVRAGRIPLRPELEQRLSAAGTDAGAAKKHAPGDLAYALVAHEYGVSIETLRRRLKERRRADRVKQTQ